MEVDYLKLSEQYASFLVAAGGVSITVLTLVLTLGTKTGKKELRTFLATALIVATISSFTGAHMLSETASFISYSKGTQTPPLSGERLFVLASINIYISVIVILFALMLLPAASGRVDAKTIEPISVSVFMFALAAVLCWMFFSITIRFPRLFGWRAIVMIFAVFCLDGVWGYLLYQSTKFKDRLLHLSFIPILILILISLVLFTLTFKDGGKAHKLDVAFFVLAVTSSCVSLTAAAIKLMLRQKDASGHNAQGVDGNIQ
jgi:hypothetical protein